MSVVRIGATGKFNRLDERMGGQGVSRCNNVASGNDVQVYVLLKHLNSFDGNAANFLIDGLYIARHPLQFLRYPLMLNSKCKSFKTCKSRHDTHNSTSHSMSSRFPHFKLCIKFYGARSFAIFTLYNFSCCNCHSVLIKQCCIDNGALTKGDNMTIIYLIILITLLTVTVVTA